MIDHDHYAQQYIRSILKDVKTVAMVGASANHLRPSYLVMKYLMDKGYTVIPVNPGLSGQELIGQQVYGALKDIPTVFDMVDIFRNAEATGAIVNEALALAKPPKVIWMQLGVRNDEAAAKAEKHGLRVVMNRCPKMEFGKLSGEWGWVGGNSGVITSQRQVLQQTGKFQSLGIRERD